MGQLDFDPAKLKKVKITDITVNTWNPKEKDTPEYLKVKESVFQKGLRGAIVVRTHPELEGKYEILDGQQRYTAADELGYEEVFVYDEGEVSDQEARELTIWYQQQVPFEKVSEAQLVTQMVKEYGIDQVEFPYTEKEIEEFRQLADFKFEDYSQDRPNDEPDGDAKTLKLIFNPQSFEIVMKAIHEVMAQNDCSESRALELICADYLSGSFSESSKTAKK